MSQILGFTTADAANRCNIYFGDQQNVQTARSAPKLNSKNYVELLTVNAKVETMSGVKVGNDLLEALDNPTVKQIIRDNQQRNYQVLLTAKLPARDGGGTLRLVTLNERLSNLAYNHIELTALLRVNPELANALGFYRVEGQHSMVWAPDVKTVNFRMKRLAKKFGFDDGIWGYEAAAGVVDTMPYLNLLAKGKFPFSGDADVNLSVHDAMHSIAFAVLNITPGGRDVLESAKSRNQIILKINERLKNEVDPYYSQKFIDNIATYLSSDSLERTMLLSIVLTGNHDYFSAHKVRENNSGLYFKKQNKETTVARIEELLKLFNYSHKTFEQALNELAPEGDAHRAVIKKIFTQEIRALKSASLTSIKAAAKQIIKFMPDEIFGDNVRAGSTSNSKLENHDPAGPETLRAAR
ncbi:hypothetical protein K2P97_04560 [bacterium]|nr:hypothetical protein [bacterium]